MADVYLETSFISACVSTRSDAASVYRRQVSREWWVTQREHHRLLVSAEVIRELNAPTYPRRNEALALTTVAEVLPIGEDVQGLAKLLVREQVMPGPEEAGDALHVATAIVHRVEFVLTWNVRHLANLNKVERLRAVCRRVGYAPPELVTPEVLWESTED